MIREQAAQRFLVTAADRRDTWDAATTEDRDVEMIGSYLVGISGDRYAARDAAFAALGRIEMRLAAGQSAGALVDECVKAGHITAVRDA